MTHSDSTVIHYDVPAYPAQAYEDAGLDWDLVSRQVFTHAPDIDAFERIFNRRALVREDTGACFAVVSRGYRPYSPRDARPLLDAIQASNPDGGIDSVWSLAGGKHVVFQFRVRDWTIGGAGADENRDYLNLHLGNDGATAVSLYWSSTRLQCSNQLHRLRAESSHRISVPHSLSGASMVRRIETALVSVRNLSTSWEAMARQLSDHGPSNPFRAAKTLADILVPNEDLDGLTVDQVGRLGARWEAAYTHVAQNPAYGDGSGSFWDFMNRATGYAQHETRRRDRLRSAVMPSRAEQATKARILSAAMQLVGGVA